MLTSFRRTPGERWWEERSVERVVSSRPRTGDRVARAMREAREVSLRC